MCRCIQSKTFEELFNLFQPSKSLVTLIFFFNSGCILDIRSKMSSLKKTFALANFLHEIGEIFQPKIDHLLCQRQAKKVVLDKIESVQDIIDHLSGEIPSIESGWNIGKLPRRLEKRYIDTGDVSPAYLEHLEQCLNTSPDLLSGIQVRKRFKVFLKSHFFYHETFSN